MLDKEVVVMLGRLRDLFPTGQLHIGGSTARSIIMKKKPNVSSDIDIYLNVSICRYSFIDILKYVVFRDYDVELTTEHCEPGEAPGDAGYYKMPNMRRRISISLQHSEMPDFDFIFVDTPNVKQWLLENQASTISECALELGYGQGTDLRLVPKKSSSFDRAILGLGPVVIDIHPDRCTQAQHRKVQGYCIAHRLRLVEKSTPRPDGRIFK